MLRRTLVIVPIALIVSACSSSRQAVRGSTELRCSELRRSDVRDSMVVEVHDTVMETTTIIVRQNEIGDTTFTSVVTERDRVRNRDRVRDNHERTVIKTDTVFIEKRDSVFETNTDRRNSRASPFVSLLRWIFWIIVSLIVFVIILKYRRI